MAPRLKVKRDPNGRAAVADDIAAAKRERRDLEARIRQAERRARERKPK